MSSFVGRDQELQILADELAAVRDTGHGRFVWVRGRRRVGKSRLVEEFCGASGARYCYFQAPRRPREEALREFADAVIESTLLAAETFSGVAFSSWLAALRAACVGATRETPAILVIDELPYLAEADDGFPADLQKAWDRAVERNPVLLVCVGSDVRMMDELIRQRAPLHGRPTRELRLGPLDPAAVRAITGASSASDAFDRYLVTGGLPSLAASWPSSATLAEFLAVALADDQTRFVTDALRILASEFEHALQARRVIEAIGHGEAAHGRIASRAQISAKTLDAALNVLVTVKGLVARDLPYAVPMGSKATKYSVSDPYLRFWLRFVGPYTDELARGRPDITIARIKRDWTTYRGHAIEPLVRQAVERLLTSQPLSSSLGGARHVGSWWRRDHDIEVDLVGGDAPVPTRIGFIGSIKWHDRARFGTADASALAARRAAVPGAAAAKLVAVSRTGVQPHADVDVSFGPDDLLDAWSSASRV